MIFSFLIILHSREEFKILKTLYTSYNLSRALLRGANEVRRDVSRKGDELLTFVYGYILYV